MSEEKENDNEKTEEPTQHRLDEAFRKGNIAFSREILHWFILGVAGLLLSILAQPLGHRFCQLFSRYLTQPHELFVDEINATSLFGQVAFDFLSIIMPIVGFFVVAAIFAGLLQTKLAVSATSIKPKFNRISPLAGLKKLFAKRALVEFVKGLIKLSLIAFALFTFFYTKIADIPGFIFFSPIDVMTSLSRYILNAIMIVVGSLTIIAILDYAYQKYELMKSLRMTKDEVKREYKSQEGDPQVKHKRRHLAQERVRYNLNEAIGRATAIITNPTHYAVAIEYTPETMDAPTVVAKGADFIALKIREMAKEKKIPIVENPPLARALFSQVDIEQEIPSEHYQAVAEVIRFVMTLKKLAF